MNEVVLVGRLAASAESRVLPSGDEIVTFRVVVDRAGRGARHRARGGAGGGPSVDTLDCAVATAALRRRVLAWAPGDLVQVHGSLHRRFWRSAARVLSRCEVQVTRARLVRRAR